MHPLTMHTDIITCCGTLGSLERLAQPERQQMNQRITDRRETKYFCVLLPILFVCAALSLAAQKKSASATAPAVFAQDKGKLTIQLNGHIVGHEEFEIA